MTDLPGTGNIWATQPAGVQYGGQAQTQASVPPASGSRPTHSRRTHSRRRLIAAGLMGAAAFLTIVGSTSTLYEIRVFGRALNLRVIIQATTWKTSVSGTPTKYEEDLSDPVFGVPLLAAALVGLLAVLLLALSARTATNSRLCTAARAATLACLGLLVGTLSVLLIHLLAKLLDDYELYAASPGPGTWMLTVAVVLAICGAWWATSPGIDPDPVMSSAPLRLTRRRVVVAASMMVAAAAVLGAASPLLLIGYEVPDTYYEGGEYRITAWGITSPDVSPLTVVPFGYSYLFVSLLLVAAGAVIASAISGRRRQAFLAFARGLPVIAAVGAVGHCWALATYVVWAGVWFADSPDNPYTVGAGFWLLPVGGLLGLAGALLAAVNSRPAAPAFRLVAPSMPAAAHGLPWEPPPPAQPWEPPPTPVQLLGYDGRRNTGGTPVTYGGVEPPSGCLSS